MRKRIRQVACICSLVTLLSCGDSSSTFLPFSTSDFQEKNIQYVRIPNNHYSGAWGTLAFHGNLVNVHFYTESPLFEGGAWSVSNGQLHLPSTTFSLLDINEREGYFIALQHTDYERFQVLLFFDQDTGWTQSFLYFIGQKSDEYLSKGFLPSSAIRLR